MVRTNTTRIISSVIAALLMICAIAGSMGGRSMRSYAAESYRTWRQYDDRWGDIMLGSYSWANVRGSGCLVTSLAMLAVHTGCKTEDNFNPGVLANDLKSVGAFNQWAGLASWASIPKVLPEMSVVWEPDKYSGYWGNISWSTKVSMLKSFMNAGYWPIVNSNTHHWVMIEGIIGDTVYMIDPASDSIKLYDEYGNVNRTDTNDFDYILVKSRIKPDLAHFTEPTITTKPPQPSYEPSIDIFIRTMPVKTEFEYGEPLDLTGGYAQVTFVDPYNGQTSLLAEPMNGGANSYGVDTSAYDPYTPGEYTIKLYAYNDYVSTETTFTVTVLEPEKEYYCSAESADLYSLPGGSRLGITLRKGDSFTVNRTRDGYGHILSGDFDGWVSLSSLTLAPERNVHAGDINGDGYLNFVDISLLNDFLAQPKQKYDGISSFLSAEKEAADVNGDGIIDSGDVISLFNLIG